MSGGAPSDALCIKSASTTGVFMNLPCATRMPFDQKKTREENLAGLLTMSELY
jgi:hypothetical protein